VSFAHLERYAIVSPAGGVDAMSANQYKLCAVLSTQSNLCVFRGWRPFPDRFNDAEGRLCERAWV
jgi:hypothetical protein